MGKRLLKSRLLSPTFNEKILNNRYNSIENLIKDNKYLNIKNILNI